MDFKLTQVGMIPLIRWWTLSRLCIRILTGVFTILVIAIVLVVLMVMVIADTRLAFNLSSILAGRSCRSQLTYHDKQRSPN